MRFHLPGYSYGETFMGGVPPLGRVGEAAAWTALQLMRRGAMRRGHMSGTRHSGGTKPSAQDLCAQGATLPGGHHPGGEGAMVLHGPWANLIMPQGVPSLPPCPPCGSRTQNGCTRDPAETRSCSPTTTRTVGYTPHVVAALLLLPPSPARTELPLDSSHIQTPTITNTMRPFTSTSYKN